ncbi:MAG: efflux RND transporter periplasmic adaptor subunit [Ectothiorhodospiraceae bacterium]|nr:efflux RND transporter periplasmic adaptor subunit [Ectothiorhodospiraceae bacterium]
MRWLIQLGGLAVLVAVVAAAWFLLDVDDADQQAAGQAGSSPAVPVELHEARFGTVEYTVEAVGSTLARESVDVVAEVAGRITRIGFEEGQRVAREDVLFELDRSREEAELREAIAQRDDAQTKLRRARALRQDGDVPQSQVDELVTTLDSAEARVAVARIRLEERTIRAPFDGVTGLREISAGAYVTPGTRLTTLDDLEVVRLDFAVPERFLAGLQPGLRVRAHNVAFGDQGFDGLVTRVGSRVDPVSRSVRVQAEIPNQDGRLRSGMFMTARLVLGERDDAVLIPEEALLSEGARVYAYLVTDDRARRVEVTTGQRRQGMVEILEGVSQGDLVVTAGLQRLRDGAVVNVVNREADNGRLADGSIAR